MGQPMVDHGLHIVDHDIHDGVTHGQFMVHGIAHGTVHGVMVGAMIYIMACTYSNPMVYSMVHHG